MEEAVYDDSGPLLTGSFMDYAMPLAKHLPDFTLQFMETPSPFNPLGVKGMGEDPDHRRRSRHRQRSRGRAVPTWVSAVLIYP